MPLTETDVVQEFVSRVLHEPVHMLHWFAAHAASGEVKPFVSDLAEALTKLDRAKPSLASEILDRLASVKGLGETPYEGLIQLLAEVYVMEGAVDFADHELSGTTCFEHEPGAAGSKNPEFEARTLGKWFAVEVKTPRLLAYGRQRAAHFLQTTARLPNSESLGPATLPRDNPVKDFLVSAEAKFLAYRKHRPNGSTLLAIVWDDFVQEVVASLCHPNSGLITDHSFYRDAQDRAVTFPNIDGNLLIRHQHQIIRATREEPLRDNQRPFRYHGPPFPPKALIRNLHGSAIPAEVATALGATPIEQLSSFAEYRSPDLILWPGAQDGSVDA